MHQEHEQLINQCVDTLIDDEELEEVAKRLRPAQSRTPVCPPKYTKLTIQVDQ